MSTHDLPIKIYSIVIVIFVLEISSGSLGLRLPLCSLERGLVFIETKGMPMFHEEDASVQEEVHIHSSARVAQNHACGFFLRHCREIDEIPGVHGCIRCLLDTLKVLVRDIECLFDATAIAAQKFIALLCGAWSVYSLAHQA